MKVYFILKAMAIFATTSSASENNFADIDDYGLADMNHEDMMEGASEGRYATFLHHDIILEEKEPGILGGLRGTPGTHLQNNLQNDHAAPAHEDRLLASTIKTMTDETPIFEQQGFTASELKLPGKKGICMTLRPQGQKGSWVENLPLVKFLDPYWNYSWGPDRCEYQPSNIEWVPMMFGAWSMQGTVTTIDEKIKPLYQAGVVKRILGFNEPDRPEQANLPVSKAVEYWPVLESAGMPLASPAVAQFDGQWNKDWLVEVKNNGFRIDYVAVHWYGWPSVATFQTQMKSYYNKYGGKAKIMITEFAVADWQATSVSQNRFTRRQVLNFMKTILPWIEAQDWIAGYAWFPFKADWPAGTCSSLFELDGTPTALGRFYKSVTTSRPKGNTTIVI